MIRETCPVTNIEYVTHLLSPGHTIRGAIRRYNGMTNDEGELESLTNDYIKLNGDAVPKVFQVAKIPIRKELND